MNIKYELYSEKPYPGTIDIDIIIPDSTILTEALNIIKNAKITEFEDEQNELLVQLISDLDETEKMELCELSDPPFTHTNLAEQSLQEKLEEVWKDMQNGKFTPQQVYYKLEELYPY